MLWGISEMVSARALKSFPLCLAPLKNLLVEISGALGMKESQSVSKHMFWETAMGYLRNGEC